MKLDKIKFAKLVAHCVSNGMSAGEWEVEKLDELTQMNVEPVEVPGKANPALLNELMRAIHAGEKIAAIKAYRSLTGSYLKEAKDAVEKDWKRKYSKDEMLAKLDNAISPLNTDIKNFINCNFTY